jgi:predicted permease
MKDLQFAIRQLLNHPGFTIAAVVTLALGIGANTAIFSLTNAVLLRMLPVTDPQRLVLFGKGDSMGSTDSFPNDSWTLFSYPMYHEFRLKNDVFSEVAAIKSIVATTHAKLQGGQETEKIQAELVSGTYFAVLGNKPHAGRMLTAADDQTPGGHPLAVMSYSWWTRRFAADPNIIGKTLTIGGTVYSLIGVAPPGFFGTTVGQSPDLWIPLAMEAQIFPGWTGLERNLFQSLYLIARIKSGVSLQAATANANVVFHQMLQEYAGAHPSAEQLQNLQRARIDLTPAATGLSRLRSQFSKPLEILTAVVALVLLIACANIANLMLARANTRRREIAVRMAIGAARWQLIRQLFMESLLLSLIGGALGVLFASWASHLLVHMVSTGPQPLPLDVAPDAPVLAFTVVLTIVTALLFGMAPAVRATRLNLNDALKDGRSNSVGHRRASLARSLIVGQVAVSLALLAAAGLFLRSLVNLARVPTGFDKQNVLLFQVDEGSVGYKEDARLAGLFQQVEQRVSALPGVRAASFSFFTFNQGGWTTRVFTRKSAPDSNQGPLVAHNVVGQGYFDAMGIPLLQGRGFGAQDMEKSPKVAVVNETFAREYFPTGPALGQRFRIELADHGPDSYMEIVGIVKDAKYFNLREEPCPAAYYSHAQRVQYLGNLVVRFVGEPAAVIPSIRQAIRQIDPNLPLSDLTTMSEQVDRSIVDQRLIAHLSAWFGALAALLACIGIYGVMSYAISRRTAEIGIRMALGARPHEVLWLIQRETLAVVFIGMAIGIPSFLAAQRWISAQVYGLAPTDPLSISIAALILLVAAALAGFFPARKAAKVDPMVALRCE